MNPRALAPALLVAGLTPLAQAQQHAPAPTRQHDFSIIADDAIVVGDTTFDSWAQLADSGYFRTRDRRCATTAIDRAGQVTPRGGASDCTYGSTTPDPAYDPAVERYRIPVVVHVIMNSDGVGALSEDQVRSQIEILNEDFLALPGTNGAPGTDCQIEFDLATQDPSGAPTNGITYTTSNSWFNDNGSYWNALAWDTSRYLNIYTNSASGALGYVPDLPQGGGAGQNWDRVVCLYSAFGRDAPLAPYDQGRTVTHEVGHYLGLYHPFDYGCGGANCYSSGDRLCDVNDESSPTFGCPGARNSCGAPAPFHNYMDYADDLCMNNFTPEQANRMRCSLLNYRALLYEVAEGGCSPADLAEPFDELDFSDVLAFIEAFGAGESEADFAVPVGEFDFSDVLAFIQLFGDGCP